MVKEERSPWPRVEVRPLATSRRRKTSVGRLEARAIGDISARARSACTANQPLENLDQIHCSHCRHARGDSTAQRRKPTLSLSNITSPFSSRSSSYLAVFSMDTFFPMGSMYLIDRELRLISGLTSFKFSQLNERYERYMYVQFH